MFQKNLKRFLAVVLVMVLISGMLSCAFYASAADDKTNILEITAPTINEQYGLTRIYLNTDAEYTSDLAASYKHIENTDHASSPVDAEVAASWLSALKLNGKTLSEYNVDQWNAVSIYLYNASGFQQYEIRVTNSACASLVPSNDISIEISEELLDINGTPFASYTKYWSASAAVWGDAPVQAETKTNILEITAPAINEQYGLTRIYLNTDAEYTSDLAASYKHIENTDHASSPVDAEVAASWLSALKLNGKTLSEYNVDQWNAVSIYLYNASGFQQYEIRVTNSACASLVPSNDITLEIEDGLLDINGNPIVTVSKFWDASESVWTVPPVDKSVNILSITGPEYNDQYGLTRIYLNTDAEYTSDLAASYKHIQNPDHASSPVDADVAASWLSALKLNGKTLAEYDTVQWNAVSIYLYNIDGLQQYEIRVTNSACSSITPSTNINMDIENGLLDINSTPFAPSSMYWNASNETWITLSDKQLALIEKISALLPLDALTLADVERYDAICSEYNALSEAEKMGISNAYILRDAESIMRFLRGVPEVEFDDENVVLNFVAFSDVHITTAPDALDTEETGCTEERYEKAMQQVSEMNVDALIFLGDMCNDTAYTEDQSVMDYEINTFKRITESYISDDVKLFYCLGNHDSQNSHDENNIPDGVIARYYQEMLGERWLIDGEYNDGIGNRHAVINGHHFISVEPKWKGGGTYTDDTIAWFEETLESIVNDPEYNDEYIFVLSHPIATGSDIYGKGGNISTFPRLHEVMQKYPQVVKFSGHTHFPMNNETIINQNDYTSVGIGAFFYITLYHLENLLLDGGTYNIKGYFPSDSRATAPGLQVEIDANGNMRMTRIDFFRNGEKTKDSWLIPAVDTEEKTHLNYYSVARANINSAPYFEEQDALQVERESASKLTLTWNIAEDDDEVYYYRIDFLQNGNVVDSRRVYSHFWRYNKPEDWPEYQSVEVDYPSFTAPYEIRLYAIDVWEKESENYLSANVGLPTEDQYAAAQSVEQLISQIGTVTVNSKSAIEAAEAAYLALPSNIKYIVSNIDALRTARLTFNELDSEQAQITDIFEYVTVDNMQQVMPNTDGNLLFCLFGFDTEPGEVLNMHAYYMAGPNGEYRPSYLHNSLDHLLLNGKSVSEWQSEGVDFQIHFLKVGEKTYLHIFWDPDNAVDFALDKSFTIRMNHGFVTANNQIIRPFTATWDSVNLRYVNDKKVSSVEWATKPQKTTYVLGEELELSDWSLLVTYSDGTQSIIPVTADMVKGFDNSTIGQKTVRVSYNGKSVDNLLVNIELPPEYAEVNNVKFLISLIGPVTENSKAAIEAAEAAYLKLSENLRALVPNINSLRKARLTFNELVPSQAKLPDIFEYVKVNSQQQVMQAVSGNQLFCLFGFDIEPGEALNMHTDYMAAPNGDAVPSYLHNSLNYLLLNGKSVWEWKDEGVIFDIHFLTVGTKIYLHIFWNPDNAVDFAMDKTFTIRVERGFITPNDQLIHPFTATWDANTLTYVNDESIDTPSLPIGDLTQDGTVDIRDLVRLKKIIVLKVEDESGTADINKDGTIDSLDIAEVRKIVIG